MSLRCSRRILFLLLSLAAMLLAVGCKTPLPPPQVGPISVQPSTTLMFEEIASLTIDTVGISLQFEWSALRGKVSGTGAAVLYTAPDTPGPDTVTVEVTDASETTVTRHLTIQVVAPTPTPTSSPTPTTTPTNTPTPTPTIPRATPTNTPTPTFTPTPTNTPTPTLTPAPTNTPTPTPTSTPTPIIIDTMDSTSGWSTYADDEGSTISIDSVPGRTNNGLEITFDVVEWGWVGISKAINPEILPMLPRIERLGFFYVGSGAPNTIEFKLVYQPDSEGESAIFSVLWPGATVTDGWTFLEIPVSALACWADTGCQPDEEIDLERVWKIDFAISNKEGDTPGSGTVILDEIQGIR
jgi:hypothetical protein